MAPSYDYLEVLAEE